MEHVMLNAQEHQLLMERREHLESHFNVEILSPHFQSNTTMVSNDIVFVSFRGERDGVEKFKDCIKIIQSFVQKNEIFDSEALSSEISKLRLKIKKDQPPSKKRKLTPNTFSVTVLPSSLSFNNDEKSNSSTARVENEKPIIEESTKHCANTTELVSSDEEVPIITLSDSDDVVVLSPNEDKKRKKKFSKEIPKSEPENQRKFYQPANQKQFYKPAKQRKFYQPTNQRKFYKPANQMKFHEPANETKVNNAVTKVAVNTNGQAAPLLPLPDVIPLFSANNQNIQRPENCAARPRNCVVPFPLKPGLLRPIVIDGSNIARAHGLLTNTYSCKGILISVMFFMQRGHSEVTALVPQFRRHCTGGVQVTDQHLLEELAVTGHVAFTPSRRIQGKRIVCYDDRFIVELATNTQGIILSNDNYRDIMCESEEFKKTIEERLLMYCFVGDNLMVANDPLGRDGPRLNEFLSFPSTLY